jgi:hypothetical protein
MWQYHIWLANSKVLSTSIQTLMTSKNPLVRGDEPISQVWDPLHKLMDNIVIKSLMEVVPNHC